MPLVVDYVLQDWLLVSVVSHQAMRVEEVDRCWEKLPDLLTVVIFGGLHLRGARWPCSYCWLWALELSRVSTATQALQTPHLTQPAPGVRNEGTLLSFFHQWQLFICLVYLFSLWNKPCVFWGGLRNVTEHLRKVNAIPFFFHFLLDFWPLHVACRCSSLTRHWNWASACTVNETTGPQGSPFMRSFWWGSLDTDILKYQCERGQVKIKLL